MTYCQTVVPCQSDMGLETAQKKCISESNRWDVPKSPLTKINSPPPSPFKKNKHGAGRNLSEKNSKISELLEIQLPKIKPAVFFLGSPKKRRFFSFVFQQEIDPRPYQGT